MKNHLKSFLFQYLVAAPSLFQILYSHFWKEKLKMGCPFQKKSKMLAPPNTLSSGQTLRVTYR